MNKSFLPVGTVVILKNATIKIMITGFCSLSKEHEGKLFDYTGCIYPEGILSSDQICLFNQDQIDEVFFKGYENDEEKTFKEKLTENYDQIVQLASSKTNNANAAA